MFKFKKLLAILLALFVLLLTSCEYKVEINSIPSDDNNSVTSGNSSVNGNSSVTRPPWVTNSSKNESTDNSYTPTVKPDGSITLKPSEPEESTDSTISDKDEPHIDDDNNGRCDKCDKSVLVYIDFFAVNDLHGKINDDAKQPGVDELTTYFKLMYQSEDNVVVLSSGDMWQGSSESNLTKGNLTTEWMNYIGFEGMAIGNHEYDWGSAAIENNSKIADFPLLAINIYAKNDNQRVDYCKSSVLIERDGVKIGIIGAAGNNYSSIASDMSKDVYFNTGKELTALVKAESEKLRRQGADIIVYSLHDGHNKSSSGKGMIADETLSSYYDVSLSSGGYVDVVFEAHTHQNYVLKDAYGVYHLQGGGENKGISHVEIAYNSANDNKIVTDAEFISNSLYQNLDDDDIVENLLDKYDDELEISSKVLGNNPSTKNSEYIEGLVAQLYYEKGIEKWGKKYDIVLGGGFLKLRSPYYLYAGEVKYSNLLSILPFDNELVLCSIKGSDLKSKFFETGNKDYHIYYGSYGSSVKNNIQSSKTYYIVVDSYTSTYKYNNLTEIERLGPDVYARDLLADYILAGCLK